MSDSSSSFWKPLAIFLLFALLGVYVLYEWYDDQLYAELANKDAQIEQAQTQTKDAETQRHELEAAQVSARSASAKLKEKLDAEMHRLEDQVAADGKAQADLQKVMESLKETHATELAAAQQNTNDLAVERDQLTARLADAEKRTQAAEKKVKTLQDDLDKMKQAIADAAAEHRTKIAELERHLNERVKLSRTTPLDAEMLRTAQEVGVLPVVKALQQQHASTDGQLTQARDKVEALKKENETTREQLAEAQDEIARLQGELQAGQTASTESTQGAASDESAKEVAALRDRLAAEARVRKALQDQHEAALAALEDTLSDTKKKLETTSEELAKAESATKAAGQESEGALSESQERVHTLEASLKEARDQAEQAQSGLQDQISALKQQLADAMSHPKTAEGGSATTVSDAALAEAKTRIAALSDELKAMREKVASAEEAESQLSQMRALNSDLADLNGTYTDRGLLLRLPESELHFQPGQASLPDGDSQSLDEIAQVLKSQPDLSALIEGHTDSQGNDTRNRQLSEARAKAVRQALVERGVDPDRLKAEGAGSASPIADNATSQGRSKNRRVEVYLVNRT